MRMIPAEHRRVDGTAGHLSAHRESLGIPCISKGCRDEAQALKHAAKLAAEAEREKWLGVVDAITAEKDAIIAKLWARLGER